jgi:hypothetical protein
MNTRLGCFSQILSLLRLSSVSQTGTSTLSKNQLEVVILANITKQAENVFPERNIFFSNFDKQGIFNWEEWWLVQ